ncbi:MAG: cytochrome oxidase subunit III [Acidobacteria bacterium]|nr:MAG: cytochrome oxidase subunit III [Acidobacteriota bacterium]
MATTVHEPPRTEEEVRSGGGGFHDLVPADGNLRALRDHSPEPSRTGIWVGLAAITMSFAALTSALIVRQGAAPDWRHFTLPRILYLNTLVLLISSVSLEVSRRRFAPTSPREIKPSARWLYATLFLGMAFVTGQYVAWRQLASEGLFLATNPSSSFFYVFTVLHALHVLGGLAGLMYVIRRLKRFALRPSTLDVTSYYWHFMDVLWLYLLLVLLIRL